MHARNRRNGAPIVATLERVYGRTSLVRDGFTKHDDGVVERQIEGPTEMLWNTSETIGYLDANNEEVDPGQGVGSVLIRSLNPST